MYNKQEGHCCPGTLTLIISPGGTFVKHKLKAIIRDIHVKFF